ncbi:uncharacterized protein [Physcomitrium patens]|uniref:uncharacterized protein isoform X2 n=1 Tax=Physcomitrium patens TaxID=3218 RepID=UPI003CCDE044
MGKNQAYKAMQRAKMGTSTAAGGPGEEIDDGMMDGSFHSPEWHAARLASLQTSHTVTWEEWKQKQKEEARRQEELEDDEAKLMREYRAQLDAERAKKLARGSNHATLRDKGLKKSKKDKDRDKLKVAKKRKRSSSKRRRGRSDSESETDSSSSEDDRRKDRDRRKSRKDRKDRKERHKSRRRRSESTLDSRSNSEGAV